MQQMIKHGFYVFLWLFSITSTVVLICLTILWFKNLSGVQIKELPYLEWFLGLTLIEIGSIVVLFITKGLKYLPNVEINKTEEETLQFMKKFISSGSTVTIVSNRIAWLGKDTELKNEIVDMAKGGTFLEVITPKDVSDEIAKDLKEAGVQFLVTKDKEPEARFTLVNGNRSGSEKLAIARGSHPEHEITIFDNNSGPQMIAMAKDIIHKSRELANAS